MEYPKFKVCVRCFTFNHSKYITDALNGFVMQQADFPYVCCIVDDASKDGEQEVIRKYVSDNFDLSEDSCHFERETDYAFITYAQHKTNKNCYFAVLYLKENHYSIKKNKMPYLAEWINLCVYEALCEGDDWWIDEKKLQKQYNALESHPEVDMCCCGTVCYKEGNVVRSLQPSSVDCILSTEDVIRGDGDYVGTCSIFQRVDLALSKRNFVKFFSLDYFVQIQGSLRGGIYYVCDCMSAYRTDSENSWSARMNKNKVKYLTHLAKVIYTLGLLDEETNYQYHSVVVERQVINVLELIINISYMPEFCKIFKSFKTRSKIRLFYNLIKSLIGLGS